MEKKKMKMWKKILICICIILVIVAIIVLWRYNILTQISQKNEISSSKLNYTYYSETEDLIMECWKKDNIWKVHLVQKTGEGDMTFWQNNNTGEKLTFWNSAKLYSTEGGILTLSPAGLTITLPDESITRLTMAVTPMLYIGSKTYEDKECYVTKIGKQEEFIEKETGMILYSKSENEERKITYEFDTVTDGDVAKPDLSQYKLIEE